MREPQANHAFLPRHGLRDDSEVPGLELRLFVGNRPSYLSPAEYPSAPKRLLGGNDRRAGAPHSPASEREADHGQPEMRDENHRARTEPQ